MTEICVGTGPCGELRYPAYQEKGGKWSYFGGQPWPYSEAAEMLLWCHPCIRAIYAWER